MNDEIKVTVCKYPDRANLVLRYVDPLTGKQKTKSAGTPDEGDAIKEAGKWEDELRSGRYQAPNRLTWADFRTRYEAERLASQSLSARKCMGSAFNHIERVLDPDRLAKLTTPAMSKFIAQLRSEGMKESTLGSHLRHLKAALRWAQRMGMLAIVPTWDQPRAGSAKARPITAEEYERLLAVVPAVRPHDAPAWQRLITGLWLSGLRIGEAVRLSWDPDAPFAIDLTGKFPAFTIDAEAQKGRRDERLPLTPDFGKWLLENTPEAERTGPVFPVVAQKPGLKGQPIVLAKVVQLIAQMGKKARIVVAKSPATGKTKCASAHDLRRSFGTRWAKRVMPAVLQRLMRHADIQTTMKFYVGLNADELAAELWAKAETTALGNTRGNTCPQDGSKVCRETNDRRTEPQPPTRVAIPRLARDAQ